MYMYIYIIYLNPFHAQTQDYCKKTGRKLKIYCLGSIAQENDYKSCENEESNLIEVIQFQVIVATIGTLAYWAAQQRKKKSRTLFENRKYQSFTM